MHEEKEEQRPTQVLLAQQSRKAIFTGLKLAAEAVGCTLGPRGRCVLVQRPGRTPLVTKDGVTVARAINLRDPLRRMGADLLKEAAGNTNDVAGDGTTTASVLTAAMVEAGLKLIEAGHSPQLVSAGIEHAVVDVENALRGMSRPVETDEEIAQVGTISANGDTAIGALISQAMSRVGRDGIITVEDAKGTTTSMEVVEGMQFDRGYLSPYFVTDQERMRALHDNAYVLVTDRSLTSLRDLIPLLERVMQERRPILIIADDVEGEALQGLVVNRTRGALPVVAIKAPSYGRHRLDLLHDICALTGATLVSPSTGHSIDKLTVAELGQCRRVVVDRSTTTIVGHPSTQPVVEQHVMTLQAQLQDVTLSDEERAHLRSRIARLSGGVAIIRVGGSTEVEMVERKYRVEDALNATRAAAAEGIVPGGGHALYRCAAALDRSLSLRIPNGSHTPSALNELSAGYRVVQRACVAPLERIASNAGQSGAVVLDELTKYPESVGFNAADGTYVNLIEQGILDPVRVTRTALRNAASVAITFLSLDAVVYEDGQ